MRNTRGKAKGCRNLEFLSEIPLGEVIQRPRTRYSVFCMCCGAEVSAPSKEVLLQLCSDWKAYEVQEWTGERSFSIYYCALCPVCEDQRLFQEAQNEECMGKGKEEA